MESTSTDSSKPPTSDTSQPITKSHKKKRSAVSKLAEKRRQSESGSELGSSYSVRSNASKNDVFKKDEKFVEDNVNKNNNINSKGTTVKELEVKKSKSVKSDKSNTVTSTPPRPKPRERKNDARKGDLSPLPPMDVDSDSDDANDKNDGTISKKAPSDATIHRFRALKMVNDKTSTDDLIKSPFMPKPPTTPRTDHKDSPNKKEVKSTIHTGEKRNRDPNSSSEETEIERKSKKQSSSKTNLKKMEEESVKTKNEVPNRTIDSEADMKDIKKRYEDILMKDPTKPDSAMSTPKSGRLSPISPRGQPPVLGDLSSKTLKTQYKSDPAYTMNKYFNSPMSGASPVGQSKGHPDLMSQRSMSTSSVLMPISIQEARARTGSAGGNASVTSAVIGAAELDRYFPDRRLKVWIGSWNMGDVKECKEPIQDFLLPESSEFVQDIYAIGTQENNMPKKEWEVYIQATLGPSHVLFYSASHGALHLAIFIRRDLIWFCTEPEEDLVTTRAVTMVKTKGAVAISFSFFGSSFLFINSHLASDAGKMKDRLSDYQKINSSLKLPKTMSGSQTNLQGDATSRFDNVFWFGDLNFRLGKGRLTVEDLVHAITEQEHPNFEDLLLGDELAQCIYQDKAFQGYLEGRINFKPTYKFDINSDIYDTSAKFRIPSYTDRILYHCKRKNSIVCNHYDSVMNIRLSDHRPIYGLYETAIRPGRENVQLAAGKFDRDVYVEANKRRTMQNLNSRPTHKSSGVCTVQ